MLGEGAGATAWAVKPDFDFHTILRGIFRHFCSHVPIVALYLFELGLDNFIGVVFTDPRQSGCDKLNIDRRRNFDRYHRIGIDHAHHIDEGFDVFNRVAIVEWKWGDDAGVNIIDKTDALAFDVVKLKLVQAVFSAEIVNRFEYLADTLLEIFRYAFKAACSFHVFEGGLRQLIQWMGGNVFDAVKTLDQIVEAFEI